MRSVLKGFWNKTETNSSRNWEAEKDERKLKAKQKKKILAWICSDDVARDKII